MDKPLVDISHLGLKEKPFQRAGSRALINVWADRIEIKKQIDRLMWDWTRDDESSIRIIWGDLGTGKSHTLIYIRDHYQSNKRLGVIPVHAVMPKEIKSFLDVYQAITAALDLSLIADLFEQTYIKYGNVKKMNEIFSYIPDAVNAIRNLGSTDVNKRLAEAWLKGIKLTRRSLDALEVNRYIKTTDDCVAMLSGIVKLIEGSVEYLRFLFMLDECQRMWEAKKNINKDVNIGLQTWYDANPNHLTLLLSCKSGDESAIAPLLTEDMRSRMTYPNISFPLLTKLEALEFIRFLLAHFHLDDVTDKWFPFSGQIVEGVVQHLTQNDGVSPRNLMKGFEALLNEADYLIMNEGSFNISVERAVEIVDKAIKETAGEED